VGLKLKAAGLKIAVLGPNGGCTKQELQAGLGAFPAAAAAAAGGEGGEAEEEEEEEEAEASDDGYTPAAGACAAALNMLGSYTQYGKTVRSSGCSPTALQRLSNGSLSLSL
jgi:hypothetical protein